MAKKYDSTEYGRNFAFVQKVENLPEDWEVSLKEMGVPMAYILHDKDVYTLRDFKEKPEEMEGKKIGEKKPDHVHFFAYFPGKRTINGVLKMFAWLNIKWVELVVTKNGKLAYFLHYGSEDKYVYRFEELHVINGLKVKPAELANLTFEDVLNFVDTYNVTKFSELVRATKVKDKVLFNYVTGHYALCCAYFADVRED